jgi:ATP-dependent helicase/nuclease subunit B
MSFGMEGPFAPVWITLSDGTKVRIYGKIDRVDRTPDGKLMRIIDYKMGQSHKFDPTLVMSGEALQLPLYFLAAKQLGGECAGFYYMPLTLDPPEPGQTSEHLLYGLTVSEGDAVSASEEIDKKSRLIYNLKKDPDGTYSGSVADRQQMETVISKAEQIAAQQASGILNGHAEILPTSKACTWCPYHSVCRFDKQTGGKNRYIKKVELSELLGGKEEQA